MYITVDAAFAELLRRIELNPSRVSLASQRYNALKSTIETSLPGKTVHQVGSFQRKTKIRPSDNTDQLDIDLVVSFGPFYQYAPIGTGGVSPAQAMAAVRQPLRSNEIYRLMPQQQDHPTVRLEYADQMAVELIPAFEDLTGSRFHTPAGPNCYIVGASPFMWMAADYDYDAHKITELNKLSDDKLVPAIKIAKAYFRSARVPLKSFHTEILVANSVPGLVRLWKEKGYYFGYQHILAGFLSDVSKAITTPVSLYESFSPPVDSGLSLATLTALGTFLATRATTAWQLCKSDSVSAWREFFGEPFPT